MPTFAVLKNNVSTTVGSTGYVAGSGSLTLVPGGGAAFPALVAGQYLRVTVIMAAFARLPSASPTTYTIFRVTGVSGDVLTIGGVLEGTLDRNYAANDVVEMRVTADTVGDLQTAANTPFGPSGTGHGVGVVPDPGGTAGTINYLREDASFRDPLVIADGHNIVLGTGSGTQVGTAATQKLGFYNATPIVRPTGDLLVALSNLGLAATPALPSGQAFLASTFTISAALGTFMDTGLAVALPSAGTYLILYNVRAVANIADAKIVWITAKLYQTDSSAFVTNSERYVVTADTTSNAAFLNHDFANQSAFSHVVTVTAPCSIKLYVKRDGNSAVINYTYIYSDAAAGWTSLDYVKIG